MRWTIGRAVAPAAAMWLAVALGAAFGTVCAAADNPRLGAGYFPNVTLTTEAGTPVRFYDDLIKGKIVAINLIYTTCQYACPLETARLAQVQTLLGDRMGRDVFFYSITIDPDHDTPAVLKAYAEKFHAGPGWRFLTGKQADIELISKKLGIYAAPDPANPDGHLPFLLVGNEATGQWMRNSGVDNPSFLARTIGDWLSSWQYAPRAPGKSAAEVPARLTFDRGQYTFANHCAACHTIGGGERLGPDLRGVATTRDRDWLTRFIVAPDKLRAAGDPIALALRAKYQQVVMPNLDLGGGDAAALIDYIDRQSRAAREAADASGAPPAAPPPAGALQPVVAAYLRIQQSLSTDTLAGVRDQARAIATETGKIGAAAAGIRTAANAVAQVASLPAARTAFGALGDAVMTYALQTGAPLGDQVKVAYCPMVRKYWLQQGDKIQNPFYGKRMFDCGRLNATLPRLKK